MHSLEQETYQYENLLHDTETQKAIRMQELYEGSSLKPKEPQLLDVESGMVEAVNDSLGVNQKLLGVIKAGDETLGIIRINNEESENPYFMVSKFGSKDGRATIIGLFSKENTLNVGRSHQDGLNGTVSRSHFSVGLTEGKVVIVDNDSSNGTELFQSRSVREEILQPHKPERFALRALKRLMQRFGKSGEVPADIPEDPLKNLETWAPRSADVKRFIEESEKEPVSESYELIGELIDDELLVDEKKKLEKELVENHDLVRMHQLVEDDKEARSKANELFKEGRDEEGWKYDKKAIGIFEEQRKLPEDIQRRYWEIAGRIKDIDTFHSREVAPDNKEAQAVYALMQEAPQLQDLDYNSAPMKDYAENTEGSWKYVPEQDIKEYLNDRIFYNTDNLLNSEIDKNKLSIKSEKNRPFDVPLDLIVHATGFDSWEGRHYGGKQIEGQYGKSYDGKSRSLDTIKHYASLPSELPPVGEIRVFIQPDGKIFCDNGSGDSHRIAAAILRGEKNIKAERITVHRLKDNKL